MRTILFTLLSLLILTGAAEARMYQWKDAATGTMQLSGTAPPWYRNTGDGPRVFVFDNGELIDDTAVPVSESQRLRLRADALGDAASALALAEPDDGGADDLRKAMEKAADLGVDVNAVATDFAVDQTAVEDELSEAAVPTSDQASALKALIDAYDLRQLEEARALIEPLQQESAVAPPDRSRY